MNLERMRIPRWPLLIECVKRPLTWMPIVASVLGLALFPDHLSTWLVAPALFSAGTCHFIYDFFLGKAVRQTLSARAEERALEERRVRMEALYRKLRPDDRLSFDAILKLESQLAARIAENRQALEMTGTLPETYGKLVEDLVAGGLDTLETKSRLMATAIDLDKLGAKAEARAILDRTAVLDERILEVRQRLSDALAQIALVDTGLGGQTLEGISQTLAERLDLARQVSAELSPPEEAPETPVPELEPPVGASKKRRERKRTGGE